MKKQTNQNGFHVIEAAIVLVVLAGVGFMGWRVLHKSSTHGATNANMTTKNGVSYDATASKELTAGKCEGVGSVKIVPPMKLEQVGFILPYGLMIGGHVTPVDHQYYNGLDVRALRDTYDVVAPADGHIVDIQHRGSKTNTPLHSVDIPSSDEYRIVIEHTCSFLTYVDLVTSLDDSIKSKLPAGWTPDNSHDIDIPVKQGQIIGHIGGQTLDFAVWDLSKPLKGFINVTAYANAEAWKPFTAPTTDYLDPSIKDATIAKYIRTVAPIDGKIDYDVAGKLIGTWFLKGTNGYVGGESNSGPRQGYWAGHLSIVPNYIDPSAITVSIGDYSKFVSATGPHLDSTTSDSSGARQYGVKGNTPDPATVSPSTGLVKYELVQQDFVLSDGSRWDNSSLVKGPKASNHATVVGVLLVQMLDKGHLKVEVFPDKTGAQVTGFDNNAQSYDRGDGAHVLKSTTAT